MAHGLDWTRMGAATGIAGSPAPELDGVFLCQDEGEAGFVGLNNTGGPVDVWVDGIGEEHLVTTGSGFCYYPAPIPPGQLTLAEAPQQTAPIPGCRRGRPRGSTPCLRRRLRR